MTIRNVPDRIAAALVAGDDAEAGRIIREAVGMAIAEHREIEALRAEEADEVSDDELAEAFRDVYAANAARGLSFGPERLVAVPIREVG